MITLNDAAQKLAVLCPFPGLRSYDEGNAAFFFGREAHLNELKLMLSTRRLVTVMGNNESGKSSLIHAGLIPELKEKGFEINGRKGWIVTSFTPRDQPVADLALALAQTRERPSLITKNRLASLIYTLDVSGSQGVVQIYKELKLDQNKNLLIVIDQFDELFRQLEITPGDHFHHAAQQFVNLLLHASRQDRYPIYFLLSMRPDLAASAGQFPGLPDAINHGQYMLPRLNDAEIKEAIEKPVLAVSRLDRRHWIGSSEEALVWATRLREEIFQGAMPPLPVIQVALLRAWEKGNEIKLIQDIRETLDSQTEDAQLISGIKGVLQEGAPAFSVSAQVFRAIQDKEKQLVQFKSDDQVLIKRIRGILEGREKELSRRNLPEEVLSVHARESYQLLRTSGGSTDGVGGLNRQRIAEKMFRALIHTSLEGSIRPVRPVRFEELRRLFSQPDRTQTAGMQTILAEIDYYQRELAQYNDLNNPAQSKLIGGQTAKTAASPSSNDQWLRDPIGSIMINNAAQRQAFETDQPFYHWDREKRDDVLIGILQTFLHPKVAILDVFGRSPRVEEEPETLKKGSSSVPLPHTILPTTYVQLSNEYLLDNEWGWKELVGWKKQEEEAAEFYRRLLAATAEYQRNSFSEKSLWGNPDLGNGIRWLLMHTPNPAWAKRYDQAYQQEIRDKTQVVNFPAAMDFLTASVRKYTGERLDEKERQKKTLEKEQRSKRRFFWIAIAAGLLAIVAFVFFIDAKKSKEQAKVEEAKAVVNQRLATQSADIAAKKSLEALDQAEQARIDREKAVDAQSNAIREANRATNALRRAEIEQQKAIRARNDAVEAQIQAEKKRAEARLAALEAELQRILADQKHAEAVVARRETEMLRNLELVRKRSLDAELLVLNGQAERVDTLLKNIRKDLQNLSPDYQPVREYFAALQAYYFYNQPYNIVNSGAAIRTAVPFDGQKFLLGDEKGFINLLDVGALGKQGTPLQKKALLSGSTIRSMALSPGEEYLAAGTSEGELVMLEVNQKDKAKPFREVDRFSYGEDSLVIIQDIGFLGKSGNDLLLVAAKDRSGRGGDELALFLFDLNRKEFKPQRGITIQLPVFTDSLKRKQNSELDAMVYDPDQKKLYVAGKNVAVHIYDLAGIEQRTNGSITYQTRIDIPPNEQKRKQLKKGEERITALGLSPDKKYLAVGLFYGDVYLVDLSSQRLVAESTTTHYTQISHLDFHRWKDNTYLATASFDHSISLVNLSRALDKIAAGKKRGGISIDDQIMNFKLSSQWVHGAYFFEQGEQQKILSIAEDGSARVWLTDQTKIEEELGIK